MLSVTELESLPQAKGKLVDGSTAQVLEQDLRPPQLYPSVPTLHEKRPSPSLVLRPSADQEAALSLAAPFAQLPAPDLDPVFRVGGAKHCGGDLIFTVETCVEINQ